MKTDWTEETLSRDTPPLPQTYLVVFTGADEPHYGYEEEEHAASYDRGHQGQRGDDGVHVRRRRHPYHDERHHLREGGTDQWTMVEVEITEDIGREIYP